METPFRKRHLLSLLSSYVQESAPLDLAISRYFKAHKSLGAADRRWIGETLFGMVRWWGLLSERAPESLLAKLALWESGTLFHDPSVAEWHRLGINEWLYQKLVQAYGLKRCQEIAAWIQTPAPITLRVNAIKTTREALTERFQDRFQVTPSALSACALYVSKREPLFQTPEFREGLFEVQDEGSQIIASLVPASPGDQGVDFCAGSGGKSLAIAPCMKGRGQLYLHDIRPSILASARLRLKRAGIQNAQVLPSDHPKWKELKGKIDWVLVDAPCSGTGTLRRNPDMKWKLDQPLLERLVAEQRAIVAQVLPLLKPGGRLIYATCSLLPEENERQVEFFLRSFPLELEGSPLSLLGKGTMDALFGAVFRIKANLGNLVSP